MGRMEALSAVLNDPARSQRDKDIAQAALDKAQVSATEPAVNELLQTMGRPLDKITYHEVHAFCSSRGWPKMREVYDRWLDAHFQTENGQKYAQRIHRYLVDADMNEWGYALELWKDSGFKDCEKLVSVLARIADASYHAPETVEHAQAFLAEMKRRTAIS
jgi:hypothetical protein